jgi:hypothetical protein
VFVGSDTAADSPANIKIRATRDRIVESGFTLTSDILTSLGTEFIFEITLPPASGQTLAASRGISEGEAITVTAGVAAEAKIRGYREVRFLIACS